MGLPSCTPAAPNQHSTAMSGLLFQYGLCGKQAREVKEPRAQNLNGLRALQPLAPQGLDGGMDQDHHESLPPESRLLSIYPIEKSMKK